MNDTLKFGSKRPLQDEDLFPLEDELKTLTEVLVNKLEIAWYKENDSCTPKSKHHRLWKVMFRIFSHKKYLIFASVKLIHSVSNILLPVMGWSFLRSLSEGTNVNQGSATLRIIVLPWTRWQTETLYYHTYTCKDKLYQKQPICLK